jgi:hypothetical protein
MGAPPALLWAADHPEDVSGLLDAIPNTDDARPMKELAAGCLNTMRAWIKAFRQAGGRSLRVTVELPPDNPCPGSEP